GQAAGPARRRSVRADTFIKYDESDRIVLSCGQPGERRREKLAVLQLGHRLRAVTHRRARIEQHDQSCIRLALEAPHVCALGARVHVPVDETWVVAFDVRAVLFELLAESVPRRAVQARQEPLYGGARDQLEIGQPRKGRGRQQSRGRRSIHVATTSHSTSSTLLPSDSAW